MLDNPSPLHPTSDLTAYSVGSYLVNISRICRFLSYLLLLICFKSPSLLPGLFQWIFYLKLASCFTLIALQCFQKRSKNGQVNKSQIMIPLYLKPPDSFLSVRIKPQTVQEPHFPLLFPPFPFPTLAIGDLDTLASFRNRKYARPAPASGLLHLLLCLSKQPPGYYFPLLTCRLFIEAALGTWFKILTAYLAILPFLFS